MSAHTPDPHPFREIGSEEIPLAFVAFLDVHSRYGSDAVELRRSGTLAVAYCHACHDVRTYKSGRPHTS